MSNFFFVETRIPYTITGRSSYHHFLITKEELSYRAYLMQPACSLNGCVAHLLSVHHLAKCQDDNNLISDVLNQLPHFDAECLFGLCGQLECLQLDALSKFKG